MSEPLLSVEDLRTTFHTEQEVVRAVDGASFSVGARETLGLVGESGSGKSVTARSILGLIDEPGHVDPDSAIRYHDPAFVQRVASRHPDHTVWPDDVQAPAGDSNAFVVVEEGTRGDDPDVARGWVDLVSAPESVVRQVRGAEIAMVTQDALSSLDPLFTVGNQLTELLRIHRGLSGRAATETAADLLESVGIPDPEGRLDEYPHQFSGGMQQRAVLAMALACEPEVLICDEPTTALDVTIQAQIVELLADLQRERDLSIVFITHDIGLIAQVADAVSVMYAGEIVEHAAVSALFEEPKHPYTRGLLRSVPGRAGGGSRLPTIEGSVPTPNEPPTDCRFADRCPEAFESCTEVHPTSIPVGDADGSDDDGASLEDGPVHTAACLLYPEGASLEERLRHHREASDAAVESATPERQPTPRSEPSTPAPAQQVSEDAAESGSSRIPTASTSRDESDDEPLVSVEGLRTYYESDAPFGGPPVKAVDDVSFEIGRGETFGLVGESGCGKTTLGRSLLRLEDVDEGRVTVAETEVTALGRRDLREWRRDAQMVFQNPTSSINERMTVGEIVQEPLDVYNRGSRPERRERVFDLLDRVGLREEHYYRYPHQFSGGQRQRIGIARALALEPEFLVLDEPVSALDVSVQAKILNLLMDLQAEYDLTYLLIAHDLSVVRHACDRVGVMYLGKLVEVGPTEELFQAPSNPYTHSLLSAIPEPDPGIDPDRITLRGSPPDPRNPPSGCSFSTRCPFKIPPEEYPDLDADVLEPIETFREVIREKDRGSASVLQRVLAPLGWSSADAAIEDVRNDLFAGVAVPPEVADQLDRATELVRRGDAARARSVLSEAFGGVCEHEVPDQHVTAAGRLSRCHRHREEYAEPVALEDVASGGVGRRKDVEALGRRGGTGEHAGGTDN